MKLRDTVSTAIILEGRSLFLATLYPTVPQFNHTNTDSVIRLLFRKIVNDYGNRSAVYVVRELPIPAYTEDNRIMACVLGKSVSAVCVCVFRYFLLPTRRFLIRRDSKRSVLV